jgi:hypothetical protein
MEIRLTEKFLLTAQNPGKGKFLINDFQLNYGIVGAILMEMTFDNKISIDKDKLLLKSFKTSSDPVISQVEKAIKNSKKLRKLKYWISKLEKGARKYKWIFLEKMEKEKLVRIEKRKFLGLITYRQCYLVDRKMRDGLIKQLKEAVLYKKGLNEENIVLLGLVDACGLHKTIASDRNELKVIKKKLKELLKDEPIAKAVRKTIAEMQAAITGAVVASIASSSAAAIS